MTTFASPTNDQNLYVLVSSDGISWSHHAGHATADYTPEIGVGNSAFIQRNGYYYLCHAVGGDWNTTKTSFGVARSTDLATWSSVTEVDMTAITGVDRVWAPTWFVDDDDSVYVLATVRTATSDPDFAIYETHPTNAEMTAWSTPVLVTGTGLPSNMIDAEVVKLDGTYYLWYKDEDTKYIEYATSISLTSGYAAGQTGNWAGWGSGVEAPRLVQLSNGNWRIYMDQYGTRTVYYSDSADDWATWSVRQAISAPITVVAPCVRRV